MCKDNPLEKALFKELFTKANYLSAINFNEPESITYE